MDKTLTRPRTAKPVDDFEDDQTGDVTATRRAASRTARDEETDAEIALSTLGHNSGDEPEGEGEVDDDGETGAGGNIAELAEQAQEFLDALDGQQAELDAIDEEARKRKQPFKDEMKGVFSAAAEERIPKKVLRALFSYRRKLGQAGRIPTKLNDEQRSDYRMLKEALGDFMDLPLGQAAVAAAKPARARNKRK